MIIITGIFFCVITAGFFAGIETGLLAADQLSLYSKKEKGQQVREKDTASF